jgi:hypothetical protein
MAPPSPQRGEFNSKPVFDIGPSIINKKIKFILIKVFCFAEISIKIFSTRVINFHFFTKKMKINKQPLPMKLKKDLMLGSKK